MPSYVIDIVTLICRRYCYEVISAADTPLIDAAACFDAARACRLTPIRALPYADC